MKKFWGNSPLTRSIAAGLLVPVLGCVSMQANAAGESASALQRKLLQMEDEMRSLRQEIQNMKSSEPAQAQQVEQLQQRVNTVEATAKQVEEKTTVGAHHDNMLFFRGGWTQMQDSRVFTSFSDSHLGGLGLPANDGDEGWYVSGGLDFILTHDVWGMLKDTWVLGELSVGFNRFDSKQTTVVVPTAECALLAGKVTLNPGGVTDCIVTGNNVMTTLNITAAPKIKFMEGSRVRPWIMPVGLDINVISPPSDSASVLDVGAVFGAGVDYELIKGIFIGLDGRYHYTAGETNTRNNFVDKTNAALASTGSPVRISGDTNHDNDYWQVGGYIGIGF